MKRQQESLATSLMMSVLKALARYLHLRDTHIWIKRILILNNDVVCLNSQLDSFVNKLSSKKYNHFEETYL